MAPRHQADPTQGDSYKLVEDGKLTVASDLATPPFEYVNDSGNDQGFTVELMDMIAQEMGPELNYLPAQKFDNIIPMAKQAVKTDVSACNITINDARKKEVDFTDPYMDSNQGVAVAKNSGYADTDSLNAAGVKSLSSRAPPPRNGRKKICPAQPPSTLMTGPPRSPP